MDFHAAILAMLIAFRAHRAVAEQLFVELLVKLFAGDFRCQQAL
ncbi:MAG: hypothetical protein R3E18_13110 [Sphingomonadaceae bacterium]